jgi:uncharacterized membrane protein
MADEPRGSDPPSAGGIVNHLRNTMGAGLLVIVPLGITLFILRFLFNLADGFFAPYVRQAERWIFGRVVYAPGLGLIVGTIVIYIAGVVATHVLGRHLVRWWDDFLHRIPLVKAIYNSAKQIIKALSGKGRLTFQRTALVDFPVDGSYAVAFVTNEISAEGGKRYFTCYVPKSNPTSGFLVVLPEERVYPLEITVEEAMKIILSGGIVLPGNFSSSKLS